MYFSHFSEFLNYISKVNGEVVLHEHSFYLSTPREDSEKELFYNDDILSARYSESLEYEFEVDSKDSEEMSVDYRLARLVQILNVVADNPSIKSISLPKLTGDVGGDYGGGTHIGCNGSFYEEEFAKALQACMSKRNDFALSFSIIVQGGRLYQICSFDKEANQNASVLYTDSSNSFSLYEYSSGPFSPYFYLGYTLTPTEKILIERRPLLSFSTQDGDENEREVSVDRDENEREVSVDGGDSGCEKSDSEGSTASRMRKRRESSPIDSEQDNIDLTVKKCRRESENKDADVGDLSTRERVHKARAAACTSGDVSSVLGRNTSTRAQQQKAVPKSTRKRKRKSLKLKS